MESGKIKQISINVYRQAARHYRLLIVLFLAGCFFYGSYSYISRMQAGNFIKWTSPDETANYQFAKLYGQTGEISLFEGYNVLAGDIMIPRSLRSDNGTMKPVSFLGMIIIYGKIVSHTSYKILPFLTPFFASLGAIFYFLLLGRIFGKRNAFYSTLLLLSFPVYFYYSARSMFHNVLFITLLTIGSYFSVAAVQTKDAKQKFLDHNWKNFNYKKFLLPALGGFFIGLAIITRTSELLWLGPVLLFLWIINIKKIGICRLAVFAGFIMLGVLPSLYWNQILHGSPISGGYPAMNQSIHNIAQNGTQLVKGAISSQGSGFIKDNFVNLKNNIFHFGFNADRSLKVFAYYFVFMFPWLFWPAVIGLVIFAERFNKWGKKHWGYIISLAITAVVLIFYYGSWDFHDNPDKSSHTIGNSYTRYWLPIYLGAMPLAVSAMLKFFNALYLCLQKYFAPLGKYLKNHIGSNLKKALGGLSRKFFVGSLMAIAVFCICLWSVNFVLFGSEEGLYFLYMKQAQVRDEYAKVMKETENNSIIITQYHDKLFFPERKVIVGLFDDPAMMTIYNKLIKKLPVYYYNFTFDKKTIDHLNNSRLPKYGFRIKEVERINFDFTLYKLNKYDPPIPATTTPQIKK